MVPNGTESAPRRYGAMENLENLMKQTSLIDRLEQDLHLCKQRIAQARSKGKDCMEDEHRVARTAVALEMLR